MKMNCNKCKQYINRYLDGTLSEKEQADLFAHLESCAGCNRYFEEMMLLEANMDVTEKEVPDGFSAAWRAKVAAAKPQKRARFNYKAAVPVLAACACAAIVISIAVPQSLAPKTEMTNAQSDIVYSMAPDTEAAKEEALAEVEPAEEAANEAAAGPEVYATQEPEASSAAEPDDAYDQMPSGAAMDGASAAVQEAPQLAMPAEIPQSGEDKAYSGSGSGYSAYDIQTVDARGKDIKKSDLAKYAKEMGAKVSGRIHSVIIKTETADVMDKILDHFDLENGNGLTEVEVLLD